MSGDDLSSEAGELVAAFEEGLYTWREVVSKMSELLAKHPRPDRAWRSLPEAVRADLRELLSHLDPATCAIFGQPDEARVRDELRRLVSVLRREGILDSP